MLESVRTVCSDTRERETMEQWYKQTIQTIAARDQCSYVARISLHACASLVIKVQCGTCLQLSGELQLAVLKTVRIGNTLPYHDRSSSHHDSCLAHRMAAASVPSPCSSCFMSPSSNFSTQGHQACPTLLPHHSDLATFSISSSALAPGASQLSS